MNRTMLLAAMYVFFTGCTTAGPYVTNISSDGDYGLNVEKCAVKLNAFMGTVSTTDCTSTHLRLTKSNSNSRYSDPYNNK